MKSFFLVKIAYKILYRQSLKYLKVLANYLKQFENVVVIVSLDAVGDKHEYIRPGASWSAPEAMCNFIREVYLMKTSDSDKLELPTHGKGSSMEIEENNVCQGFWSPIEMVAVA